MSTQPIGNRADIHAAMVVKQPKFTGVEEPTLLCNQVGFQLCSLGAVRLTGQKTLILSRV